MSRRELADAVNAYLWDTYRRKENLTENDIGKLERGVTRWPSERRREAFRTVLGATTDAELGFFIIRGIYFVECHHDDGPLPQHAGRSGLVAVSGSPWTRRVASSRQRSFG